MPVERAPYLIYSESVATVDYDINSDADVLAIIAPTRFAKNLSNSVIESETLYKLKIYSEQEGTTLVGNCTCKLVETESETHIQLMVVESDSDSITVDTKYFVVKDAKTDESVMYELFSSVGSTNFKYCNTCFICLSVIQFYLLSLVFESSSTKVNTLFN